MKFITNDGNIYNINPEQGLPERVFLEVSSMMPIPNVDLLILNKKNQILLSWRDDIYYGKGWHLPGGCIRFKESMKERIHKTAINELGCDVIIDDNPLAVRDVIVDFERQDLADQNLRAHNVAIMYKCYLQEEHQVHVLDDAECSDDYRVGDCMWFDQIPENMLSVHSVYNDIFIDLGLMKKGK